jgi:hypothetical protein
MEFQKFINKIGARYSIVNGDLTESSTGEFVVSEVFGYNTIYLNKIQKTCELIPDPKLYIGIPYVLRRTDCITLVTTWLDTYRQGNFGDVYSKISRKDWMHYYKNGMKYWFLDNGFKEVAELKEGDCLVYEHLPKVISHIGVYIEPNKILHHIPSKLSCLDTLNKSLIIGAYRYGN